MRKQLTTHLKERTMMSSNHGREAGGATLDATFLVLTMFGGGLLVVFGAVPMMADPLLRISGLEAQIITQNAGEFEQWSIANPHHPLTYQQDISYSQLREQTDINFTSSGNYDIHRTPDNIMCFIEEDSGTGKYAVSLKEPTIVNYEEHC